MKHRADHAEAFEPTSQAGGLAVVVGLVVPVRRRGVMEERALGRLGLLVARLLAGRSLDPGAPVVVVVVDDTLSVFHRCRSLVADQAWSLACGVCARFTLRSRGLGCPASDRCPRLARDRHVATGWPV